MSNRPIPPVTPPGLPRGRSPADIAARFRQALQAHRAGRLGEAERGYHQIIDLDPMHAEAIHHLGVIAYQAGAYHDAVQIIRDSLRIEPRNPAAWSNYGLALERVARCEEAVASYDRALALKPAYPEALYNRGNALREIDRLDEALESYDKSLQYRPNYVEVHVNRGRTLADLGRLEEAIEEYETALGMAPDLAAAQLNEAVARLALGDYGRGLPLYEARWSDAQLSGAARTFLAPQWDGLEPVSGSTILLHAEQGLGDSIQFCRYAPLLAAQGARVILEVQPSLVTLMRSLDGVAAVLARGDALPEFDLHCPLLSLPLACGTRLETIPASPAYLRAEPQRVAAWRARLDARPQAEPGPRIGLICSGNPQYNKDRQRSVPLARFEALFAPGRDFVSLQKEFREEDREVLRRRADRMRSFADEIGDFADTAALIDCMDLVIAVDTAGAHLAAALGKPLWLLLPFAADWRWLRGRTDSPWYPTARLFRQPRRGDWDSVLAAVGAALDEWRR
jgi:tetratricopeptide (TPR) repeat protein